MIAAGVGSFQPRRLVLDGADRFEGKSLHYRVKSAADFHGQDLVICGGGDSALDWTVALGEKARSLDAGASPRGVPRRAGYRRADARVGRGGQDAVRRGAVVALHGERRQAQRLR